MQTSALFGAKIFEFFEIYVVSARTRAERQCEQGKRESIFHALVRTFFMDSLFVHISIIFTILITDI